MCNGKFPNAFGNGYHENSQYLSRKFLVELKTVKPSNDKPGVSVLGKWYHMNICPG
jgi:hypothetical protein